MPARPGPKRVPAIGRRVARLTVMSEEEPKMPRSRPWLLALSVIALALSLTASPLLIHARAQEQIELRVWDQFTEGSASPTVDAVYAAFMEANPNITITREAVSSDQMRQTVNTAIASGTGPDVILYDAGPSYAGLLADAGLLLPLDDYATQYGWKERVAAPAIEATTFDGSLYGMPLTTDLIGMFYNKTLLDQEGLTLPTTLDELVAFCGEATAKGYIPIAFGNNPGWEAFHQFSMTSNQMLGPEAMRALLFQNQGNWDTPEIATAIEAFFVTLRDAGCFPEDANAITYDDGNLLFFSGQALLHTTGSWLVGDIAEQMPDTEVGFVPFPALEGGHGSVWISGVGSAWFITASSAHPDEAAAFIDYMYSPESLAKWVGENRFFVPVEVDTSKIEVDALTASVLSVLQTAGDEGVQFGYNVDVVAPPAFNDMMQNGFQAILAGDKTPEQQAADLQTAWEEGMAATAEATPAS
jgi:raffinose/stachyose/melibiose transport system substrate-binding protein